MFPARHICDTEPKALVTAHTVKLMSRMAPSLVIIDTSFCPSLKIFLPSAARKYSPASACGVFNRCTCLHHSLGNTEAHAPESITMGERQGLPSLSCHAARKSLILFFRLLIVIPYWCLPFLVDHAPCNTSQFLVHCFAIQF